MGSRVLECPGPSSVFEREFEAIEDADHFGQIDTGSEAGGPPEYFGESE